MAALDQVRPFLQRDGGDYTEDKTVLVRLQGHCAGCPHAQMTIKYGIEQFLKDAFGDAVSSVEAVM